MTPLIERIAKELSHDFGGHGDITDEFVNAASNVIDAITLWASQNPTEAAPWEEHFVGWNGPWTYQFQHKFPRTVLVSEDEAALIEMGINPQEVHDDQ